MKDELANLDAIAQADLVAEPVRSPPLNWSTPPSLRIEAVEPHVHALTAVDFEAARRRARAQPRGPLGGVPFL